MEDISKYFDKVFGFEGQVAIICSIIATVICIFIPQDIRQSIIFRMHKRRRTLKYVFRDKSDKNGRFLILSRKQNQKIIKKYFDLKYDKIYIKILDFRKYKIIKEVLVNNKLRRQKVLRNILKKLDLQCQTCVKAVDSLLIDKSAIYSEIYRKKYSYNNLIISIIDYVISERDESPNFEVKFAYYKTKKNGLPTDIELKLKLNIIFLEKYFKKIEELYFDITKMDQYIKIYDLNDVDDELLYKAIDSYKRNNMDIYDLEIEDFIKYIAPRFYIFISNICDGEWTYSKLDKEQYRIDHFEFDLQTLYRLCKKQKLIL